MAVTTKTTITAVDVKSGTPGCDPVSGISITAEKGDMPGVTVISSGVLKTDPNQSVLELRFNPTADATSPQVARNDNNQADVTIAGGRSSNAYIGVSLGVGITTAGWSYELELTSATGSKFKYQVSKM